MATDKKQAKRDVSIVNRRASFEYHILQTYDAGMVLKGTEVKAIREGKANLADAFCYFLHGELYIKNLHISEYKQATYNNHDAKRVRKLLLTKRELVKMEAKAKEKGFTIIPVRMYTSERGFVKLEIAYAQGKKFFDKRNSIKEKDVKRELDRTVKR